MDIIDEGALLKALKKHDEEGVVPFHMPGHKRNPKFCGLMGLQSVDITEIDGFDDLHRANGILKRINDLAAQTYGARASRMSVGGSTACILACVRALSKRGRGILIARNCHSSVYNAAEICELNAHYVSPEQLSAGFYGSLSPSAVEEGLKEHRDADIVVVTSPTYEGVISDIAGIAEVCKKYGARLVVDEAHGAHLGSGGFEQSARQLGADIVVNSLHKTLPSLTQTAVLHVCARDIDVALIDEQLAVFESSSPSYPLMASVECCLDYLQRTDEIETWYKNIVELREGLSSLEKFALYAGEGAFKYDISKLTFVSKCALSGTGLMRKLREEHRIELEMAGANYAVGMCGAGDTPEMYAKLKNAMFALERDETIPKTTINKGDIWNSPQKNAENENTFANDTGVDQREKCALHTLRNVGAGVLNERGAAIIPPIPKKIVEAYEAKDMEYEIVPIESAEGRIAAENIRAYPPGSPLIVKGEEISADMLAYLLRLFECGVEAHGSRGAFPQNIAVLA